MQGQWPDSPRYATYWGLSNLALQFLRDGVDDPRLNRELLELFPHRFELCAEFKRLFVYGCSLSQAEIAAGDGRHYGFLRRAVKDDYDEKTRVSMVSCADELP